jgi:hypothetical protein
LRCEDYLDYECGLIGVTRVLLWDRGKQESQGQRTMESRSSLIQSQVKECLQTLEAAKANEWILPQRLYKEHRSVDLLILSLQNPSQTFGLYSYMIINLFYFKQINLYDNKFVLF